MSVLAAEAERTLGGGLAARGRAKPRGLWSDAWRRLRRNRAAVAGLGFILLMVLVALFAPLLAPHDPETIPATARSRDCVVSRRRICSAER